MGQNSRLAMYFLWVLAIVSLNGCEIQERTSGEMTVVHKPLFVMKNAKQHDFSTVVQEGSYSLAIDSLVTDKRMTLRIQNAKDEYIFKLPKLDLLSTQQRSFPNTQTGQSVDVDMTVLTKLLKSYEEVRSESCVFEGHCEVCKKGDNGNTICGYGFSHFCSGIHEVNYRVNEVESQMNLTFKKFGYALGSFKTTKTIKKVDTFLNDVTQCSK